MAFNLNKDNEDDNTSGSKNKKNQINLSKKEENKKPNLEKSNSTTESKSKGINLNKSSDLSKSDANISKTESTESKSLNQNELKKSNSQNKKSPILIILIIVSILGFGLFWVFNKNNTNQIVIDNKTQNELTEKPDSVKNNTETIADTTLAPKPIDETNVTQVTTDTINNIKTSNNEPNLENTTYPGGSIEIKAIQVIRGEFGTGVNRKNALGENYLEIQAKVNEILRGQND